MDVHADYVKLETLSRQLIEGQPEQGINTESFKFERPYGDISGQEDLVRRGISFSFKQGAGSEGLAPIGFRGVF